MNVTIQPSQLYGEISVPPSKSMMQRACAAALLHKGTTLIYNYGRSDDELAALNIMEQLGASYEYDDDILVIESNGINPRASTIVCSESGLSARLFTPIAALAEKALNLTGEGSLMNRPMGVYADILPQLGVRIESADGKLPINIQGPLQPKDITVNGALSSQFISGLLFAFAFGAKQACTITVNNLNSKPYIDLTLQMLDIFGRRVTHDNYQRFFIQPQPAHMQEVIEVRIENDWSSAAPWLVAAATGSYILAKGLNIHSRQADKDLLYALQLAGAETLMNGDSLAVQHAELKSFSFDATHCPDLFPMLAILAARCNGTSNIKGLGRLAHKESNRAKTISEMLTAFGIEHHLEDDALKVSGTDKFAATTINTHNDHRIAMAAAVAAQFADGPVTIAGADCVAKSYPAFFEDLRTLNGNFDITE